MSMTIAQLKQELLNHGVPLPESSSRKEVYEKLYQEFVVKPKQMNQSKSGYGNGADTFSSDEEVEVNGGNGSVGMSNGGEDEEAPIDPEVVAEVEKLSNEEIYNALTSQGQYIGPVVASTRQIYKNRLVKRLSVGRETIVKQPSPVRDDNGFGLHLNGHDSSGSPAQNTSAQLSSDEEMDSPTLHTTTEPEPDSYVASVKLTTEQKQRLEEMMSTSYYSSPLGPSPSTSRQASSTPKPKPKPKQLMEAEAKMGTGVSLKIWAIGILMALIGIYIAYEVFEESRAATANTDEF